jgi:hypothetical protein
MVVLVDLFIISLSVTVPRHTSLGNVTESRHICVTERYVNPKATCSLHMPPSYFRPHRYSERDDADVSISHTVPKYPLPVHDAEIFFIKGSKRSSTKIDTESARCPASNPRTFFVNSKSF